MTPSRLRLIHSHTSRQSPLTRRLSLMANATRATRGPTNILHWNMDGYNNKAEELDVLLQEYDVHIAFLNETKLRPDQHLRHRGFRVIRSDGSNGQGGVAALVKRNLACAVLAKTQQPRRQSIRLELGDGIGLTGVYNSPRQLLTEAVIADLFGRTSRHLVIGDLNARHVNWNNTNNNANGTVLNNFAERTNFVVHHPDEPTCYSHNGQTPSTIDIVLNKGTALLGDCRVLHGWPSDHCPVFLQIRAGGSLHEDEPRLDFSSTNWAQFRARVCELLPTPRVPQTPEQLNRAAEELAHALSCATLDTTPLVSKQAGHALELPDSLRRKIEQRKHLRRLHQRSGNPDVNKSINRLTAEIKETVASIKSHNWAETLRRAETANGSAWKLTRILTKSRPKIHHLETDRGPSCRPEEIAETLAGNFEAYHQLPEASQVTAEEVERTIGNRRKGPDDLGDVAHLLARPRKLPPRRLKGPSETEERARMTLAMSPTCSRTREKCSST
ncbi:Endonuclease-reverse transcriptase [Popillia japonica]|uniref:Endonuclease-reverse transcriptase n=1 Tax=Popillia japonica TaxID=7064 RepID=A0AAW1IFP2_POPJA